ncbi:MAG: hypothetical protein ABI885_20750 [Gammaproteobacteria bacterium]
MQKLITFNERRDALAFWAGVPPSRRVWSCTCRCPLWAGTRASSALIAQSTLIATPGIVVSTWLYSAWSTKESLIVMIVVMMLGLAGLLLRGVIGLIGVFGRESKGRDLRELEGSVVRASNT